MRKYKLSSKQLKFIQENPFSQNWELISKAAILSERFITKYRNFVSWKDIVEYQKLSEEFIIKYFNKYIYFELLPIIIAKQKLSSSFLDMIISWKEYLTLSQKEEIHKALCYNAHRFPKQWILNNRSNISIFRLIENKKLPNSIIFRLIKQDKKDLTDTYLWEFLSKRRSLSKKTIIKYFQYLSIENLLCNPNISEDTKNYVRMFI